MASQEKLPEKVQTQIVNKLLARPGNERCADCLAKGPCWISLDFGVFICLNCSGEHRNLGPHITRVRSLKLDKWTTEWAQIMDTLGNEVAANYYERNMPASTMRPNPDGCSAAKTRTFIIMKYVQEAWAPENEDKPFTLYQKRMNPEKYPAQQQPNGNQRASEPPQNTHHHVDLLDLGTPPALEQNRSDPNHAHGDLISFDTDVIVSNTGRRRSHRKSMSGGDLLASPAKLVETLTIQQPQGQQQPQGEEAKKQEKKNAFDFIKSKPAEPAPQAPAPSAGFNMPLYNLQPLPTQPVQTQVPLMTLNATPAYQQPAQPQQVPQSAPKPSSNIMDLYNNVDVKPHSVSPEKSGGFQRGDYRYLESLGKPPQGLPQQQGLSGNLYGQQPMYPGTQMQGGFRPANQQQNPGLYGVPPGGPMKTFQ